MPVLFHSLLGPLVRQLCPNTVPGQIDYLIIHLYLASVLLAALLLSLAALFRYLFATNSPPPPLWADEQQTVDVFLDWDACDQIHLPLHLILDQLRAALDACWPLAGSERRARLVFSCYLNRADPRRAPLLAQLEALEQSSDGSVLLFDTAPSHLPSDQTVSGPAKPLLQDLLKLDSLSTGRRLYVVSTADDAICQHGLALLKTHPCPPLLCYIPPFGLAGPTPEPAAADFVFRWVDDRVVVCEERVGVVDEPWGQAELAEFRPLVLLVRAYGPSLRLHTVTDALATWFFDPDRPVEDTAKHVDAYIEDAVAKGLVVLSRNPLGVKGAYEDTTTVLLGENATTVLLSEESPAGSPASVFAKDLTPDSVERSGADEDRLTTTGSDSEDVSSKQSDSPTLRGKLAAALNETFLATSRQAEQEAEQQPYNGKPQKHKQVASETGPPVKKKKNHAGGAGGALPAAFRAVSKTRRRSLRMASPSYRISDSVGAGGPMPAVEIGGQKVNEWVRTDKGAMDERATDEYATDERVTDECVTDERVTDERATGSPPQSAPHSRPRSIGLGTAACASPEVRAPGSLPAHLHSLPCSPGLWMHTSSGLVDGVRAPMSSLGFGSLYGRSKRGMNGGGGEEGTGGANERFARLFSPMIGSGSGNRGASGTGAYPFPVVLDEEEEVMDVD